MIIKHPERLQFVDELYRIVTLDKSVPQLIQQNPNFLNHPRPLKEPSGSILFIHPYYLVLDVRVLQSSAQNDGTRTEYLAEINHRVGQLGTRPQKLPASIRVVHYSHTLRSIIKVLVSGCDCFHFFDRIIAKLVALSLIGIFRDKAKQMVREQSVRGRRTFEKAPVRCLVGVRVEVPEEILEACRKTRIDQSYALCPLVRIRFGKTWFAVIQSHVDHIHAALIELI